MITSSSATTHQIQEYTAKSTLQIVMLIAPRIQFQTHTAKNRVPPLQCQEYRAKNTSSIKYRWLQCTDQWPPRSAYIYICIYMHYALRRSGASQFSSFSCSHIHVHLHLPCRFCAEVDPMIHVRHIAIQCNFLQCSAAPIYTTILGLMDRPACQSFWGKNREKDIDK